MFQPRMTFAAWRTGIPGIALTAYAVIIAATGRTLRASSRSWPPRSRAETTPTTWPGPSVTTTWWMRFHFMRFQALSAFSFMSIVWTFVDMMSRTFIAEISPSKSRGRPAPPP